MSYTADETYDIYHETYPKARKPHTCVACRRDIRPGDVYTRVYILFDGSGRTVKRCLRCQSIHLHLRELCREADYDMWPHEALNCGSSYEDEWEVPPPEDIQAIAFMTDDEAQAKLVELVRS